jgi:hypothetical protein
MWQAKCGLITGPPSRYAHINKSEEHPSIIDPGMTLEGNGNTLEQDVAESPKGCGEDGAENITTDLVPITDQPPDVEPQNESDQSKSSHQGDSHQMDSQSGSSIQSHNKHMRSQKQHVGTELHNAWVKRLPRGYGIRSSVTEG